MMVEVTKADREAWIAYEEFSHVYAQEIRSGSQDMVPGLQAFARHRIDTYWMPLPPSDMETE